jgi:hypothetical protein
VIERIFGVLKKRFKVLIIAQEYSFATQSQLVSALAALHNFIIIHDPGEIIQEEVHYEPAVDDPWNNDQGAVPRNERTRAAERRDRIAKEMWEEYVTRPQRRRR